jgi:hypothetical protein
MIVIFPKNRPLARLKNESFSGIMKMIISLKGCHRYHQENDKKKIFRRLKGQSSIKALKEREEPCRVSQVF